MDSFAGLSQGRTGNGSGFPVLRAWGSGFKVWVLGFSVEGLGARA